MAAPESSVLYLFGDQVADVLPSIQDLSRRASASDGLRRFWWTATDRLRRMIDKTSFRQKQRFIAWDSLAELAAVVEREPAHCPPLKTALCCICQFGYIILYLEQDPRALEVGPPSKPAKDAVLGFCTGLLSAAAFSCCRNLSEVLRIAPNVVVLAFQLGLEASRRSEYIDPSTASESSRSWATVLTNTEAEDIREALASFNQHILPQDRQIYISAQGASSVTVSGPPVHTAELFQREAVFQGRKKTPLPIAAAFHAGHLKPVPWKQLIHACLDAKFETFKPNIQLISPSYGLAYAAGDLSELLNKVVEDILQRPIFLEKSIKGAASIVSPKTSLISFGPASSTKAIMQSMKKTWQIDVEDKTKNINETSPSNAADIENAIAIVGMSVRLPGSETLEEFWEVLEQGRDLHEKIRPDRFDVGTHYDPTGKLKNSSLTPYGVFIDRPGYFDTRLFNMSPREAAQTDPQQRLMLLTTYEALEMAGYTPNGSPSTNTRRIGSWMGQTSDDWREVNASQNVDTYFITGGIRAFGPGRLNYHFGWEGPSYSVDTACSSSAASIQLACSALLSRECDTAVCGGANFLTASDLFAGLSRGSFLSKTGGCKTFDHDADGYVRADAVGVVVMKRLVDALAERDNVLAVLRGAVTNHSAEAISITHPHAETQERLFAAVLNRAGIQPHEVDYAELHGTGTQAGDATELKSVTNILARGRTASNPLYIGTVKPNLGHGEAGSGVTSLIKAIMMLRKNMIPPHVGIKGRINQKLPPLAELNTHISFVTTPFLPRDNGDGKRRILINNFDAAGGNTSMLIEDPPILQARDLERADPRSHHVVTICAKTPTAAANNSRRLLDFLKHNPGVCLQDVAYTTTARRIHYGFRRAEVVSSVDDLIRKLEKQFQDGAQWVKSPTDRPVVFLFTGQGSLYTGMSRELFNTHPGFRETILDCDRMSTAHGFPSFVSIISNPGVNAASANPVQAQLAIVAVELALVELWKSFGVVPTAVIGHSLGEYAALCAAGVLSVNDCLYLVGTRASLLLTKCKPASHTMLAVQDTEENLEVALVKDGTFSECEIACVNGASSTVISGPVDQISSLREVLLAEGKRVTPLDVQYAFHSAQMDPLVEDLVAISENIHFAAPCIPVASTQSGTLISTGGIVGPQYLKRQTRQKVEFLKALEALESLYNGSKASPLWIEIGPSPVCLGMVRDVLGKEAILLPSLKRGDGDWKTMTQSVAHAYAAGVDINWKELHRPFEQDLRLIELPRYAFDLKNYWIQYEGDWAIRKGAPSKTTQQQQDYQTSLAAFPTSSLHRVESLVRNGDARISVTFATDAAEPKLNRALRGHLVNGAGLCPSSVYADMAFTAASYIHAVLNRSAPLPPMDVRDMEVHTPLLIQPGPTRQIIRVTATLAEPSTNAIQVKFSSEDRRILQDHAHCLVEYGEGDAWKSDWARTSYLVKSRMDQLIAGSSSGTIHKILRPMVYKLFAALVEYDDKYKGLQEVYLDSNLLEATARVRFCTTQEDGRFIYSPYWIDSLAHLSGFVLNGADTTPADIVYISHGWKSLKIVGELSAERTYQSYVRMQETRTKGVMSGDVFFFENGEVIAVCQELKFQRIKRTILGHLLGPRSPVTPTIAENKQTPQSVKARAPTVIKTKPVTVTPTYANVLEAIASEVGVDVSELTDDVFFADLGVDSLLTISITARLSAQFNQKFPTSLFIDSPSVQELRAYFEDAPDNSSSNSDSEPSNSDEETRPETPLSEIDHTSVQDPGSVLPTDWMRELIASEVGIDKDEVDEHMPLSELGVDSLLSLSILSNIKAQTGRVLPSDFLIDHPTLADIRVVLEGPRRDAPSSRQLARSPEESRDQANSLSIADYKAEAILLQGYPSDTPGECVFLFPDGSGSASSYVGLPSLNVPGPVYGLNSPFLNSPSSFTCSIPEVAAMYVHAIQRVQPVGPYRLGGWSIGGTFAFEAAAQLIQKHDQSVHSLILIDAPCPKVLPPLPIETIDLLEAIGVFDVLKNDRCSSQGSAHSVKSITTATTIPPRVREHFASSIKALKAYVPQPISTTDKGPHSVTVLWAQNGVWETVGAAKRAQFEDIARGSGNSASRDWILDPRQETGPNGWESLLAGASMSCGVIPGDHFTMMRKPGVIELGVKLRETMCSGWLK